MNDAVVRIPNSPLSDGKTQDAPWAGRRLQLIRNKQGRLHAGTSGGCRFAEAARAKGELAEVVVPLDALEAGWALPADVCCVDDDAADAVEDLRIAQQARDRSEVLERFVQVLRGKETVDARALVALRAQVREIAKTAAYRDNRPDSFTRAEPLRLLREWAVELLQVAPAALADANWLRDALAQELAVRFPLQEISQRPSRMWGSHWYTAGHEALYEAELGQDLAMADVDAVLAEAAGVMLAGLEGLMPEVTDGTPTAAVIAAWEAFKGEALADVQIVVFESPDEHQPFKDFSELCASGFLWSAQPAPHSTPIGAGRFGVALLPAVVAQTLFPSKCRVMVPALPGEESPEFLKALSWEMRSAGRTLAMMMPSLQNLGDPLYADPLIARVARVRKRLGIEPELADGVGRGQGVTVTVSMRWRVGDPQAWSDQMQGVFWQLFREAREQARADGEEVPSRPDELGRQFAAVRRLVEHSVELPSLAGLDELGLTVDEVKFSAPSD